MHAELERIYGPTIRYGPPEPLPIGLATELRKAAESRNRIASEARRLRDARNAYRFQRLLQAQHGLCYLCEEPFSDDKPPTKDHVWPKSRGGKNVRNILWACMPCNNGKGDDAPTEAMMIKLREINAALDAEPLPKQAAPIPLAFKRRLGLVVRN